MNAIYDGRQAYILDDFGDGVYLDFRNEISKKPLKVFYGDEKLNIDPTDSEWEDAN
jgi:hypothetical protein